jgi:sugar phosphate isomerase/epimerase
MQIGMMNDPKRPLIEEITFAGLHNFDFIDLTLEPPLTQPQDIDVKSVKSTLQNQKVDVIGHTNPFLLWASPIKSLRDASIQELKEAIKVFDQLGVKKVNIHSHWYQPNCAKEDILKRNIESLGEILEEAKKHSLQLMLEHQPNGLLNQPEDLSSIFAIYPELGFHLDVGHANVAGQGKNLSEDFLKLFGNRLKHVHFSDNQGQFDDHLALGEGKIQWEKIVKLLKKHNYNESITLEVFVNERKKLLDSKRWIRDLWEKN